MGYVVAHCLTYCSRIGRMPIGRHLLRNMANDNNGLPKKPFCGGHVPLFTQQRIDHIAFPIDGTVEVTPFSIHFDVRFIYIPGSSCLPTSLRPQLLGNKGSESCFPNPDCFMCERKAALEKHVSEITQTQLGAQSEAVCKGLRRPMRGNKADEGA